MLFKRKLHIVPYIWSQANLSQNSSNETQIIYGRRVLKSEKPIKITLYFAERPALKEGNHTFLTTAFPKKKQIENIKQCTKDHKIGRSDWIVSLTIKRVLYINDHYQNPCDLPVNFACFQVDRHQNIQYKNKVACKLKRRKSISCTKNLNRQEKIGIATRTKNVLTLLSVM